MIGRRGLGLGKGLHGPDFLGLDLPEKKEGDLKAPAGVFFFGDVYGYAARAPKGLKLNYIQALESFQGVDDPASRFYNRIVDTRAVGPAERDWKSHEQMYRKDGLYRWLAVIRHNDANAPGGGSLIFMHIWKAPDSGTAGCTAMAEADLLEILRRLDPKQQPILVQLPASATDAWWQFLARSPK